MRSKISTVTNNLGNIRYSKNNPWIGLIGKYKGFCKFESDEYGIRAMLLLIRNYIINGFDTPNLIISRYAPQEENDTHHYIKYVCSRSNGVLTPHGAISNLYDLCFIVQLMIYFESNVDYPLLDIITIAKKYSIHL